MEYGLKYALVVGSLLLLGYLISFILRRLLSIAIKRQTSRMNADPTKFVFIKNSVSLLVFTVILIIVFFITPDLRGIGKGLFAGAGILAAVIGLASQKAFSNILSGVFILVFKPFSVNDTLEIRSEGFKGVVEEITLRHTLIRDYENRRIIIPNSLISEASLVNSSIVDQRIRKHIHFSISYESDIDLARAIITEEIIKHPLFRDNRSADEKTAGKTPVLVRLYALSDFSMDLRAYVWTDTNDDAFVLQCDVLEAVKKRFDKEGIEIPYPHRTLVEKKRK